MRAFSAENAAQAVQLVTVFGPGAREVAALAALAAEELRVAAVTGRSTA